MTMIVKSRDCGNSPKNLLVQALVIAIETSNRTSFSRCVSEDVTWAVPGRSTFEGRAAALEYLASRRDVPHKVIVKHAISHGRVGAGEGATVFASSVTRAFCHVVEFSSAKGDRIASVTTYLSDLAGRS